MNFAGKVISPPTGEQIYCIGAELTSNEKKICISKTNNKVSQFALSKSSTLNFLGTGFLLDSP